MARESGQYPEWRYTIIRLHRLMFLCQEPRLKWAIGSLVYVYLEQPSCTYQETNTLPAFKER